MVGYIGLRLLHVILDARLLRLFDTLHVVLLVTHVYVPHTFRFTRGYVAHVYGYTRLRSAVTYGWLRVYFIRFRIWLLPHSFVPFVTLRYGCWILVVVTVGWFIHVCCLTLLRLVVTVVVYLRLPFRLQHTHICLPLYVLVTLCVAFVVLLRFAVCCVPLFSFCCYVVHGFRHTVTLFARSTLVLFATGVYAVFVWLAVGFVVAPFCCGLRCWFGWFRFAGCGLLRSVGSRYGCCSPVAHSTRCWRLFTHYVVYVAVCVVWLRRYYVFGTFTAVGVRCGFYTAFVVVRLFAFTFICLRLTTVYVYVCYHVTTTLLLPHTRCGLHVYTFGVGWFPVTTRWYTATRFTVTWIGLRCCIYTTHTLRCYLYVDVGWLRCVVYVVVVPAVCCCVCVLRYTFTFTFPVCTVYYAFTLLHGCSFAFTTLRYTLRTFTYVATVVCTRFNVYIYVAIPCVYTPHGYGWLHLRLHSYHLRFTFTLRTHAVCYTVVTFTFTGWLWFTYIHCWLRFVFCWFVLRLRLLPLRLVYVRLGHTHTHTRCCYVALHLVYTRLRYRLVLRLVRLVTFTVTLRWLLGCLHVYIVTVTVCYVFGCLLVGWLLRYGWLRFGYPTRLLVVVVGCYVYVGWVYVYTLRFTFTVVYVHVVGWFWLITLVVVTVVVCLRLVVVVYVVVIYVVYVYGCTLLVWLRVYVTLRLRLLRLVGLRLRCLVWLFTHICGYTLLTRLRGWLDCVCLPRLRTVVWLHTLRCTRLVDLPFGCWLVGCLRLVVTVTVVVGCCYVWLLFGWLRLFCLRYVTRFTLIFFFFGRFTVVVVGCCVGCWLVTVGWLVCYGCGWLVTLLLLLLVTLVWLVGWLPLLLFVVVLLFTFYLLLLCRTFYDTRLLVVWLVVVVVVVVVWLFGYTFTFTFGCYGCCWLVTLLRLVVAVGWLGCCYGCGYVLRLCCLRCVHVTVTRTLVTHVYGWLFGRFTLGRLYTFTFTFLRLRVGYGLIWLVIWVGWFTFVVYGCLVGCCYRYVCVTFCLLLRLHTHTFTRFFVFFFFLRTRLRLHVLRLFGCCCWLLRLFVVYHVGWLLVGLLHVYVGCFAVTFTVGCWLLLLRCCCVVHGCWVVGSRCYVYVVVVGYVVVYVTFYTHGCLFGLRLLLLLRCLTRFHTVVTVVYVLHTFCCYVWFTVTLPVVAVGCCWLVVGGLYTHGCCYVYVVVVVTLYVV